MKEKRKRERENKNNTQQLDNSFRNKILNLFNPNFNLYEHVRFYLTGCQWNGD